MKYIVNIPITEWHVEQYCVEAESEEEAIDHGYDLARHNNDDGFVKDELTEWFLDGDIWIEDNKEE